MSPDLPTSRELEAAIADAMIIDRGDLRSRLAALRRAGQPTPAQVLALARDIDSSNQRRRRREERRPRPRYNQDLPVSGRREEIAKAIMAHQAVVLCGETGSGKTTQLPQICLDLGRGVAGMIGHTQPRRIAARTVAQRIADELGSPLGKQGAVGFKVRFGDETSPDTFIKLMTDGILLAETQGDRDLEQYDTIIIDEAHERSLNIDFLMGYLRQLMPRRPDLKIIITSATIDPQKLSNHFGGPGKCPVVEVSGRTYPVEVRYRAVEEAEPDDFETDEERAILDAVDELARPDLPKGDVLIFLPGEREIRLTAEALRKHHPPGTEVLPLYARLSPAEQMRVFQPDGQRRRIVLATNVAETSLTVPGIRYVVDSGLARISRYSHRTKVQRLPIEPVSQASANQRAGRCGRVAAGVCIRLFSEDDFKSREAFTEPEILRTNLASVILQMKSLRLGPVEEFPFVDPPDARMIRDGYETLEELGAIDEKGELTKLGRDLAKLPLDPRIGRLLLAAASENCLTEVLIIASALEVQDPRDRPMDKQAAADEAQARFRHEQSDFLAYVNIWKAYHEEDDRLSHGKLRDWCRRAFLNFMRMREWVETYHQIKGIITEMGFHLNGTPASYDCVHRALLAGLLSNVCCKNESGGGFDYMGARGSKVSIFPGSALFKKGPKWFMAAEIVQTTRLYARTIAKIEPEWIEEVGAHVLKKSYADPHWSPEAGQVSAWERITIFGLVLVARRRVHYGPIEPKAAREIFIHRALVEGDWPEGRNEGAFQTHNRAIIAQVEKLQAKLRRSDILADNAALFSFYDSRLPQDIHSVGVFDRWRTEQERAKPRLLYMGIDDVLAGEMKLGSGGVAEAFPDNWPCPAGVAGEMKLEYVFEPGKEHDGVTLVAPLASVPQLDEARCEWLVPGLLRDKVHGLLKTLPKQHRVQLDQGDSGGGGSGGGKGAAAKTGLAALAEEIAGVLAFGQGTLGGAMTEALEVLRGVVVPASAWQPAALPDYLRLNVRVVDERGKSLGESRDVGEIKQRLAGKARKALAGIARAQFGREGLTSWDFEELPDRFEMDRGGQIVVAYPAVVDRGEAAALTLLETPEAALAGTHAGVRRLLAIACKEELGHRLRSLSNIDSLYKWFAPLGEPAELKGAAIDLIVERAFLAGQPPIRTRDQFDERQSACWGRLGQVTIEVGTLLTRVLEARHKIAARLGSGVPRTWAVSIADLREHAAYLMPKGFLRLVPMDRLKEYPRYVEAMRLRLEKLREGGSTRETKALADLMPHWKRYTGWVAQAAGEAKAHEEAAGPADTHEAGGANGQSGGAKGGLGGPAGKPKSNQPLPAARRAAPVVPTEAAAWASKPGSIPPAVDAYRWMLEEFRVSLFAQELGTIQTVSPKRLEEQWGRVEGGAGG